MSHQSAPLGRRAFLSAGAAIAATVRRPRIEPSASPAEMLAARVRRPAAETPYWLEATGTPGMAVALLEAGRTVAVLPFGFTAPDHRIPVSEDTIFQAASLSKQAVLHAALATVDAGKLDLDRPLTGYLEKPLDAPEADLEHVTARHVLTHTTGGGPTGPRTASRSAKSTLSANGVTPAPASSISPRRSNRSGGNRRPTCCAGWCSTPRA